MQLSKGRLSGALARRIVETLCTLETPTAAEIAKELRVDARRVNSHLEALADLFVVREITPDSHGVGKSMFMPFDAGLAKHLGAPLRRLWQTWFLNERVNHQRFSGLAQPKPIGYYLTARHSFVDFVDHSGFHLFTDQATPERRELMTMRALQKKIGPKSKLFIHCATNTEAYAVDDRIFAVPWAQLATGKIDGGP